MFDWIIFLKDAAVWCHIRNDAMSEEILHAQSRVIAAVVKI